MRIRSIFTLFPLVHCNPFSPLTITWIPPNSPMPSHATRPNLMSWGIKSKHLRFRKRAMTNSMHSTIRLRLFTAPILLSCLTTSIRNPRTSSGLKSVNANTLKTTWLVLGASPPLTWMLTWTGIFPLFLSICSIHQACPWKQHQK